MAGNTQSSTLVGTERRLRPLVVILALGCTLLATVLLVQALPSAPRIVWAACLAFALAGSCSNLLYRLMHPQPSVGMIPIALLSLLFASVPGACSTGAPPSLRIICLVAIATIALLFIPFAWTLLRMASSCLRRPEISPDAALIVLGGAVRNERPSPTLCLRLDTAVRTWRQGTQRTIVVTGGPVPNGTTTEADVMATYLQSHGVDAAHILREPTARNTQENIERSLGLLEDHGHTGQRCIVSSNYHLWRALRDARQMGYELVAVAAPCPLPSIPQQWSREALTILAGR